jgi:anti-anti-sigma factor
MGSPLETSAHFRMRERLDPDGTLRLALSGELDLSVAQALADRLQRLRHQGYVVRVDLSRLEFIDSSGLRELILAGSHTPQDPGRLEVDREVSEPVRRVIEVAGVRTRFWRDLG